MELTMKKILDKFSDCDTFSLTGQISRSNYSITREEFEKRLKKLDDNAREKFIQDNTIYYRVTKKEFVDALKDLKEQKRANLKNYYEDNRDKFNDYPEFEKLYDDIEQECYDFCCDENKKHYLERFNGQVMAQYKKIGLSDNKINNIKKNFFKCSFITDNVGKTTRYGDGVFRKFYSDISFCIDLENSKLDICNEKGIDPIEQIPRELRKHLISYKISYYNSVTMSSRLMINYYFRLNDDTKKYLLGFKSDFDLKRLDDLAIFKNDKLMFSSCTHERFNSIDISYFKMSYDEKLGYVNDEYPDRDNNDIVEIIDKIIALNNSSIFSFKELGVEEQGLMNMLCTICNMIELPLLSAVEKELQYELDGKIIKTNLYGKAPALLCKIDDLLVKL